MADTIQRAIKITLRIPERNRAVKALLQRTYPGVNISVRAGRGTAHHWIDIEFFRLPDELRGLSNPRVCDLLTKLIRDNDLHVSTYAGDGQSGGGDCLDVRLPRSAP